MCLTIVIKQIKIYDYIFYNIYSCSRDSTKTKYLLNSSQEIHKNN